MIWKPPRHDSIHRLVGDPQPLVQTSQKLILLRRKVTVAACFDFPLTSERWHLAQSAHRILHCGAERRIVLLVPFCDLIITRRRGDSIR
jgi:hypothetical protein